MRLNLHLFVFSFILLCFSPFVFFFSLAIILHGKQERCQEPTPEVPRVEETHKSHTKDLFTSLLEMGLENDQLVSQVGLTKVNVSINKTNEREEKGLEPRCS